MALRFRNLSGNPYAGLASTAESVYGRLGSTYLRQAEDERRRREREDAQYNQMLQSTVGLVAKGMEYDIQQDKIARDNALKRIQLEDSSFNILAKNLKPSSLQKFVSNRNKYIDKVYKGEDVEFGEGSFYGQQLKDDDFIDPTRMTPDRLSKLSTAFKNVYKPINDFNEEIKKDFLVKYGKQAGFDADGNPAYKAYSYSELQTMKEDEDTRKSIPQFYFNDSKRDTLKSEEDIQKSYRQFLVDNGYQEITWQGFLQQYGTGRGGQFQGMTQQETGKEVLKNESRKQEISEIRGKSDDIAKDTGSTPSGVEFESNQPYERSFVGELESIFGTDSTPKLSKVEKEGTPTSSAQIVEEPSVIASASSDTSNFGLKGDGSSQLQVAGDVTGSMLDLSNNTAIAQGEGGEKRFSQDTQSLMNSISEARKEAVKLAIDAKREEQERKTDAGRKGFVLSDKEAQELEKIEKQESEDMQLSFDVASKNLDTLITKTTDGKTFVQNTDGSKELINDGSGFVEPILAPSLVRSEQSVIDAYMDPDQYRSKYAEYYSSTSEIRNRSDPRSDQLRILENRIIGHYNDAFANNPTISKKDARSLAVNKTAEEAYKISYQNSTEEDEMAREMRARAVQNNAKNFAKAIFTYGAGGQSDIEISQFYGIKETADDKLMQYLSDEDDATGAYAGSEPTGTTPYAYENPFFDGINNPNRRFGGIAGYIASVGMAPEGEETAKKYKSNNITKTSQVAKLRFASPSEMEETVQKSSKLVGDVSPMAIKLVIETESARGKSKSYDKLGVNKGDQNTKWIDSMDISDEEKEDMKQMYSDSYGIGQMGLKAFEVAKKGLEKDGVYIDWDMYKKGHLETQVNAVAGYIKYGVIPRLESLYGRNSSNSRNPTLIALAYKGGLVKDRSGKVVQTERAKKLKLESTIAKVYKMLLGYAQAKASD